MAKTVNLDAMILRQSKIQMPHNQTITLPKFR